MALALGAFDLEACIGRGGMGQVWRGIHRRTDYPVAVKILDAEAALRPGFSEAFQDEARVVAGLAHPNIVTVLELGVVPSQVAEESDGALIASSPYLVMEYAHRGTLERALREMSWQEMKAVLIALLSALAHAHARGVIHLDIKPANLLLGCGREAPDALISGLRLTDFGLAWQERAPGRAERRAELGGTLGRMAPEQIQATWREYGPWTDLYAVGAMVWQYATGSKPFSGTTRAAMLVNPLINDLPDFSPIRPVPEGLETWIRVMMARDAAVRYQAAADAAAALHRISDELIHPWSPAQVDWSPDAPTTFATLSTISCIRNITTITGAAQSDSRWRAASLVPPSPLVHWKQLGRSDGAAGELQDIGLGLFGLRSVPFVGREQERDQLWQALSEVRSDRKTVAVLLRGPAGVGKSCLAQWVGQRAMELGVCSVFLRADHATGLPAPEEGLRSAIARHLGCVELDRTAAEKHLVRVLGRLHVQEEWLAESLASWLVPGAAAPAEPPAVLMTVLLRALGRRRPVVMWLDDIQWGAESLEILRHLLRYQDVEPPPLLVVMTAGQAALVERPEVTAMLAKMEEGGGLTVMDIGALEPPDDELLIRSLATLEPSLAARLAEHVAGNPLLAVHIVGDWISREELVPTPAGFQLKSGITLARPDGRLPETMRALWQRRLWRLAERVEGPVMEALELAALMGTEVNLAEWRALLAGWDPEPLVDALMRARLARPSPRGWSFVHGMLREVLAAQARQCGRWAAHHRACAGLLVAARTPELQERLGHHLLYAGEARMAFAHLIAAARTLDHRGVSRTASRVISRAEEALDALKASDVDRRRCACRILACQIQIRRHHPSQWIDELCRWRDVAVEQGWEELEAEVLWVLGEAYQKSDRLDEAHGCLEAAQALADRLEIARLKLEVLTARALLRMRHGDQVGAAPLLLEVLAQPVHPEAPTVQLSARLNLASIARLSGDLDGARRYAAEAVRIGQTQDCLDVVSHGLLILGVLAERSGDLATAERQFRECLRIARRTGKFRAIAIAWNSLGEIARREGRLAEAEERYRTSLAWAEAGGRPMEPPQVNLALVLTRRGRYAEARALIEVVIARARRLDDPFTMWCCQAFIVPALAGMGDWEAFDRTLAAVIANPVGQNRYLPDIAEEAERAGYIAQHAGQQDRSVSAWRFARDQWRGLGRTAQVEILSTLLE